jgi:hypothetical protein
MQENGDELKETLVITAQQRYGLTPSKRQSLLKRPFSKSEGGGLRAFKFHQLLMVALLHHFDASMEHLF